MAVPKVLMVAEKPSLAQAIAGILSHGQATSHRRALEVHEFEGKFQGQNAHFFMTSVIGHVFSIDFLPQFQSWENTDPKDLFHAGTKKSEANPKAHVKKHLHDCAKGCSHIVLWLDCDREGENICFEVLECAVPAMSSSRPNRFIWRAKFSAISAPEITSAMANLGEPSENEALAVDARQELDLKVGVAFTRYQTRFFQGKYGNLDANVISYGPCQTPTLNFAVEQHQRIVSFVPEPYWSVAASCIRSSGQKIALEWSRSRVFKQDVGRLLLARVQKAGNAAVTSFSKDEGRKQRPHGLNTVALLKVASSSLNIGPQRAMQVAEALYTQGYLSYPRTESSAYPPNFDFNEILRALCRQPVWVAPLQELQQDGFKRPQGGSDMGDHPPITPVAAATEAELGGGDEWRIYDYIARHFLGSLCPDCVYQKSKATLQAGGEIFTASGTVLVKAGFTAIMPWAAPSMCALPEMKVGEKLPLKDIELRQGKTSPPDYLTEADLIGLMEQHGIGTDASISVHVHNVCERGYLRVETGRRVIPTDLGITLISGYQRIDPELCRPQVRAHVESQIALIAAGKADKAAVVEHTLQQFLSKFLFFSENIARMDVLFEANFAPLTASGKPLSLCGKCKRYMRYISARPTRLFCPTCEEIYSLPQGGDIKLYSGAVCPLDSFELVTFTLGGRDGKRYALCPFCYNHPPFEDLAKPSGDAGKQGGTLKAGMPCTQCAHPTCKHGFARMGVMACPDCEAGTIVLDPGSHPRWRLDCNLCNHLVYLPPNLHTVKVTANACEDCGSKHLSLTFRKGHVPEAFPGGDEAFEVCIVCDDRVLDLCEYKHGNARPRYKGRGGGRGRGRGRGRRGRGRHTDAKMTFHGF